MSSLSQVQISDLIGQAMAARNLSYSPYSHFRVGAALLTADGRTILGANIENSSYGGTICAERTALVKAVTEGHGIPKFVAIAVASDVPGPEVSPCGICRQVIREFCPLDIPIYMAGATYKAGDSGTDGKTCVMMTLEQLLPMSFGPEELRLGQSK